MARLVIGTSKAKTTPAVVRDVAPAHYIEKSVDANGKLINGSSVIDLTGVTDIGDFALIHAYSNSTLPANTNLDFSSLTTLSGLQSMNNTFQFCTGLTSVNLSSLTTISSNCMNSVFAYCSTLTSVNLSSLTTISGSNGMQYAFRSCTGLTSINLPSLTTISGGNGMNSTFQNCTGITSMDFPSLTTISGGNSMGFAFQNCTGLTRILFYALDINSFGTFTNQFNKMLSSCSNVTVHFPMRIQSTIGSWASVTDGFGGTNTTVLFDIVCTLTGADTNTYTRSQKNSTSTATAWDNGGTLYYTSGTSEPAVSDTIYSDAACTTAVTTISSIA